MNFREYAELRKKADPDAKNKGGLRSLETGSTGSGGGSGGGFFSGLKGMFSGGKGSAPAPVSSGGGATPGSAIGTPSAAGAIAPKAISTFKPSSTSGGYSNSSFMPKTIGKEEMDSKPKKCWHRERLEKIKKTALEKDGEQGGDGSSSIVNRDTAGGSADRAIQGAASSMWDSVKAVGSAIVSTNPNRAKAKADGVYGKNEYFKTKLEQLKKN